MSRKYKIMPEYCWTVCDTRFNFRLFIFEDEDVSYITEITNVDRNYHKKYNKEKYQRDKDDGNLRKQDLEYHKEYYQKNKDKILEQKKEYYLDNIDLMKQKNRDRYIKDPEHGKKHYRKYKKQMNQNVKDWYKKHPEKLKLKRLKAEAKLKGWGNPQPINEHFKGSHFHHLHVDGNHTVGIYIPEDIHRSIPHRHDNQDSMNKINKEAIKWYK